MKFVNILQKTHNKHDTDKLLLSSLKVNIKQDGLFPFKYLGKIYHVKNDNLQSKLSPEAPRVSLKGNDQFQTLGYWSSSHHELFATKPCCPLPHAK